MSTVRLAHIPGVDAAACTEPLLQDATREDTPQQQRSSISDASPAKFPIYRLAQDVKCVRVNWPGAEQPHAPQGHSPQTSSA